MGSDGHIEIYNWTKTLEHFPELIDNDDLRHEVVGNAYAYKNPVGEGYWLVGYWGDNLIEPTFPGWNEYTSKPKFEKSQEIVKWMKENAQIVADWEIWT